MSTLHVLAPSLSGIGEAPALRRWLAHGDRLPELADARTEAVRECFRFAGEALPVAALRHHCHADDAGNGIWLCADPAWVRSEAPGARLMACPVDGLSASEAAELAATLRPVFGDAGVPLQTDAPSAWCVHLERGTPQARFTQPSDALGADLIGCLPAGEAGRKWRHLFNEAQIVLHAHPVNAARIAAGRQPVNALWFWGAGSLPEAVTSIVQCVASSDDVLCGLAKLSGAACVGASQASMEGTCSKGDALIDLDTPDSAVRAQEWLALFQRWLREHRLNDVVLVFASGEHFRLRHVHRLRFWRRA